MTTDLQPPAMRPYGRQILICENGDCADSEAASQLQRRFAELARAHRLNKLRNPERVKCTLTGCLGVCGGGPILVVYPDGIWYHHVDAAALERIVNEHILHDRPVEELIFHRLGATDIAPEQPVTADRSGDVDDAPEEDDEQVRRGTQLHSTSEALERRKALRAERKNKGLWIVNTGNGKGKTTAALGVVLRSCGRDMRIGGVQFFKHENANFGELRALAKMGVQLTPMCDSFTWTSRDMDETQAKALSGWEVAKQRITSGDYDVFLLDEFTYLLHFGWLDTTAVVAWIAANKPPMLHLIITGRDAPPAMLAPHVFNGFAWDGAQSVVGSQQSVDQYAAWFADVPASRQDDMVKQWGPPPGGAFVHDGALALAGLEFGNVFVALQPPRGYDMDANAIYHRPDLPPPHNYYALYRWLREAWGADAIVHMGKHGTLEWLPGKGVGLSNECYPDLFLDDLPLIYPFIINDPGEGNQSKRRAHAVVIDHMTPPMTSAGAYGTLAEFAQLVDEYYQMELVDPAKLPLLQRQIWDVVQKSKLDDDLQYILKADHVDPAHDWDGEFLDDGTPTAFAELEGAQVAHLLENIEGCLCELTSAQIRDGLHILGTVAQDKQLVELLYHLLRLPNLQIPSLPASVAALLGEDWDALQERPGERRERGATSRESRVRSQAGEGQQLHTNADVIAWIEGLSKTLLLELAQQGAHDEITNTLRALEGRFIVPGPSGAPTRGMAHVLPPVRNFYAIDPRALPSMAAWQIGQGLAENLINRYQHEHGSYPSSVGISIWGTSAIRTAGDDIAEVLALLGVRPVWQAADPGHSQAEETPIVSREFQKTGGLLLGYVLNGLTWSLFFSLVFFPLQSWLLRLGAWRGAALFWGIFGTTFGWLTQRNLQRTTARSVAALG